jgi:hypothetical protein
MRRFALGLLGTFSIVPAGAQDVGITTNHQVDGRAMRVWRPTPPAPPPVVDAPAPVIVAPNVTNVQVGNGSFRNPSCDEWLVKPSRCLPQPEIYVPAHPYYGPPVSPVPIRDSRQRRNRFGR